MEIWKDIPNHVGRYKISNLGRVKSFAREKQIIMRQSLTGVKSKQYMGVNLYLNKKRVKHTIHKLVAMAFLSHKPDGTNKVVVDHIDNNKLNNKLNNLQLISQRENTSKDRKGYSSKYIGVSWNKRRKKWQSLIQINGVLIFLGMFDNEIEASNTYQLKLKGL
tara:strand:+ start:181 stop:669 length:489 start_codon:yes stop_codon:yes gene_type:complete